MEFIARQSFAIARVFGGGAGFPVVIQIIYELYYWLKNATWRNFDLNSVNNFEPIQELSKKVHSTKFEYAGVEKIVLWLFDIWACFPAALFMLIGGYLYYIIYAVTKPKDEKLKPFFKE